MTRYGLDYYSLPAREARDAGASFVIRYLSHTPGKDLSLGEAKELAGYGIDCVVMWETAANRAFYGDRAGEEDAHAAVVEALACGMVGARPIYFTVDEDTTNDVASIISYFEGVRRVLGVERTGAYGGITTIARLFDDKLISWGWQTSAWSYGAWDPRAHIRQVEYDRNFDRDIAITPDFGQWRPGVGPPHPHPPAPASVLLPREKMALDRYKQLSVHAWAHKAELKALKAQLTMMRKAIWQAANNDGLTGAAWAKRNRAERYLLIAKYVPAH